jgi:hypothetical protein
VQATEVWLAEILDRECGSLRIEIMASTLDERMGRFCDSLRVVDLGGQVLGQRSNQKITNN